jgi:hypothetical protein
VEVGASIFVRVNKNMFRATKEFNLSHYGFEDEDGGLTIWDGERIVFSVRSLTYIYTTRLFLTSSFKDIGLLGLLGLLA